jgi:RNA polymerase sigma factor (sigma-70 family)
MRTAEMQEALRAIDALDEASKEAVLLRFVEGLTPQEIGRLSGESANVISVRLNRAMKKVRATMHTHD